jgi:hypothetical protein
VPDSLCLSRQRNRIVERQVEHHNIDMVLSSAAALFVHFLAGNGALD